MKDAYIRTRVTEEVKTIVNIIAKSQGLTESEYLRFLITREISKHKGE